MREQGEGAPSTAQHEPYGESRRFCFSSSLAPNLVKLSNESKAESVIDAMSKVKVVNSILSI